MGLVTHWTVSSLKAPQLVHRKVPQSTMKPDKITIPGPTPLDEFPAVN